MQVANNLTVAGNLTVNGTLTSLDTTNLDIEDNLFQLNAGLTGSPVNDSGMLINRGSSDNGIFMWDESVDKFTLGLTTADGTSTGNITLSSLGTLVANLEGNVTGTIQTAAQPNITSLGTLTSLTIDNINIDGGEIDSNTNIIIDAAGDITLDADGGDFRFKDAGTTIATYSNVGGDWYITANSEDKDIVFQGNDGGSTVQALKLDMSDAGTAIFNHDVKLSDNGKAIFGAGSDLQIYHNGTHSYISDNGTGDLYLQGSSAIRLTDPTQSENFAVFNHNGAVNLYHDSSLKFQTTSTGINVIGTVTSDGLTVDGDITISDATPTITFTDTDNNYDATIAGLSGSLVLKADSGAEFGTETIQFHTGGSQRATINSSGQLGIGTTSAKTNLDVVRGGTTGLSAVNARTVALFQNNSSAGSVISVKT